MKVVEISARKNMLKLDNGTQSSWYKINDSNTESLEIAQTLTVNNEVDVKFTVVNGVSVVNQIIKSGSSPEPKNEENAVVESAERKVEIGSNNNFNSQAEQTKSNINSPVYTCKECGRPLKDNKYEKCYTCNQADKEKSGGHSPAVSESIRKQATGHMTSVTVAAMIKANITSDVLKTTLTVDDVVDMIDKVYDKYNEKVKI